jgi:TM2 domain-containing membrane protein YozV
MNCAVHTDTPAVAFCRTCGKALCENCKRDVMGAIYCEPCIAVRLQGGPAQGGPAQVPPGAPAATVPGAPNPGIAAFLGFIPGVGAMYNGQFLKGFIHVVIFVLLIIGADRFWGFGLMIPFFIFYMVFDAFKTAQARQFGLPAPDPLGIDRMFGLQETHPPASPPATASMPDPSQFSTTLPPAPPAPQSNQPVGAIILIALGVLFLLGNVIHFTMERFWPVILICIGLWIAYKRTSVRT